jgi:excisionase family DNA binding protein
MPRSNGFMDVTRRVYFVSEVAEILGVSRQTVLKYIKEGLVPGIRVGGRYLIMKDEFETFLRSGGRESETAGVAGSHARGGVSPS